MVKRISVLAARLDDDDDDDDEWDRNTWKYIIMYKLLVLDGNTWKYIIVYKLLVLDGNTWKYIIVYKLLVLDGNTWNHIILYKLSVFDRNTLYHITVKKKLLRNNFIKNVTTNVQEHNSLTSRYKISHDSLKCRWNQSNQQSM